MGPHVTPQFKTFPNLPPSIGSTEQPAPCPGIFLSCSFLVWAPCLSSSSNSAQTSRIPGTIPSVIVMICFPSESGEVKLSCILLLYYPDLKNVFSMLQVLASTGICKQMNRQTNNESLSGGLRGEGWEARTVTPSVQCNSAARWDQQAGGATVTSTCPALPLPFLI